VDTKGGEGRQNLTLRLQRNARVTNRIPRGVKRIYFHSEENLAANQSVRRNSRLCDISEGEDHQPGAGLEFRQDLILA
jgi:hypothetical protein